MFKMFYLTLILLLKKYCYLSEMSPRIVGVNH
jgi:hypothetical protein